MAGPAGIIKEYAEKKIEKLIDKAKEKILPKRVLDFYNGLEKKEGKASDSPIETKAEEWEAITEEHANEIDLGFFAHLGHAVQHSWKEAFKGRFHENDGFIKKTWEAIKGFGLFLRNLWVEAKGFLSKHIGSFEDIATKTALSSYWMMEKIDEPLADKALTASTKLFAETPEQKVAVEKATKAFTNVYHASEKKNEIIDSAQELVDYLFDKRDKFEQEELQIMLDLGIDWFYELKKVCKNDSKQIKEVIFRLEEIAKKRTGNSPLADQFKTMLNINGLEDLSKIVYFSLFPDSNEKNLWDIIVNNTEKGYDLLVTGGLTFSGTPAELAEAAAKEGGEILKKKFRQTQTAGRLVKLLLKLDPEVDFNLETLIKITDELNKEDLKAITKAVVDAKGQAAFNYQQTIQGRLAEQGLFSKNGARLAQPYVERTSQAAIRVGEAIKNAPTHLKEFIAFRGWFDEMWHNRNLDLNSWLRKNIAYLGPFQKSIALGKTAQHSSETIQKVLKYMAEKGYTAQVKELSTLADEAKTFTQHAKRLAEIQKLAEAAQTSKNIGSTVEIQKALASEIAELKTVVQGTLETAKGQIKKWETIKDLAMWKSIKEVSEMQLKLLEAEEGLIRSAASGQKFKGLKQMRVLISKLAKQRTSLSRLIQGTKLKQVLELLKRTPGALVRGAAKVIPIYIVGDSLYTYFNSEAEFKNKQLVLDLVTLMPCIGPIKIAFTDGIVQFEYDEDKNELKTIRFELDTKSALITAAGITGAILERKMLNPKTWIPAAWKTARTVVYKVPQYIIRTAAGIAAKGVAATAGRSAAVQALKQTAKTKLKKGLIEKALGKQLLKRFGAKGLLKKFATGGILAAILTATDLGEVINGMFTSSTDEEIIEKLQEGVENLSSNQKEELRHTILENEILKRRKLFQAIGDNGFYKLSWKVEFFDSEKDSSWYERDTMYEDGSLKTAVEEANLYLEALGLETYPYI